MGTQSTNDQTTAYRTNADIFASGRNFYTGPNQPTDLSLTWDFGLNASGGSPTDNAFFMWKVFDKAGNRINDPSYVLQSFPIPVVAERRGIGETLQDHLQLRMAYRVSGAKTLNTLSAHWWGKLAIGMEYLIKRSGPMAMAPSQLGVFANSGTDGPVARPDIQYHVQPLSLEKFGEPLHAFDAFTGLR